MKISRVKNTKTDEDSGFPNEELIKFIQNHSNLMQLVAFCGTTKSWRGMSTKLNSTSMPWLELSSSSPTKQGEDEEPKIFDITFTEIFLASYRYLRKPLSSLFDRWDYCMGCSNGAIICKHNKSIDTDSRYFVLDPVTRSSWVLPNLDASNIPFKSAFLTSSIAEYKSNLKNLALIVITSISQPALMVFWLGRRSRNHWFKLDCSTVIDPYCSRRPKQLMKFASGIPFNGKFYALSVQGTLAVIEFVNLQPQVTALGSERAVPSLNSLHFREYLIESNGEILLVFLISKQSLNKVDDLEIYRLEESKLTWVRINSIEETTLFIGSNCCVSVAATKVGCRRNCVYFSVNIGCGWSVFDMEDGAISSCWDITGFARKQVLWMETHD